MLAFRNVLRPTGSLNFGRSLLSTAFSHEIPVYSKVLSHREIDAEKVAAFRKDLPSAEVAALTEKSRLIFGNQPHSPVRSGNKVLRQKLKGPVISMLDWKPFEVSLVCHPFWFLPYVHIRKAQV